jgi:hypothetical protein
MSTTTPDPLIESYVRQLRARARTLPRANREELIQQIQEHLREALPPGSTEADARNALDQLGEPDTIIAEEYDRLGIRPASAGKLEWAVIFLLPLRRILAPDHRLGARRDSALGLTRVEHPREADRHAARPGRTQRCSVPRSIRLGRDLYRQRRCGPPDDRALHRHRDPERDRNPAPDRLCCRRHRDADIPRPSRSREPPLKTARAQRAGARDQ